PGESTRSVSGSAGYVFSQRALELIVTKGLENHPACGPAKTEEDQQIGLCAQAVGVQVRDSYDFLGKSRFSNVSIFEMLGPFPNNTPRWYPQETDYTLPKFNLSKLPASPLLVSFTGIEGTRMYVLEYLLYHLRAFGIKHRWSRDNCSTHS
ncbi:Glycoprotein-N-acetylgalactosamine 3-beta-galactosyltransferase 1, partial [Fasciolopsis buskii]